LSSSGEEVVSIAGEEVVTVIVEEVVTVAGRRWSPSPEEVRWSPSLGGDGRRW
jgi:hypothetical protein